MSKKGDDSLSKNGRKTYSKISSSSTNNIISHKSQKKVEKNNYFSSSIPIKTTHIVDRLELDKMMDKILSIINQENKNSPKKAEEKRKFLEDFKQALKIATTPEAIRAIAANYAGQADKYGIDASSINIAGQVIAEALENKNLIQEGVAAEFRYSQLKEIEKERTIQDRKDREFSNYIEEIGFKQDVLLKNDKEEALDLEKAVVDLSQGKELSNETKKKLNYNLSAEELEKKTSNWLELKKEFEILKESRISIIDELTKIDKEVESTSISAIELENKKIRRKDLKNIQEKADKSIRIVKARYKVQSRKASALVKFEIIQDKLKEEEKAIFKKRAKFFEIEYGESFKEVYKRNKLEESIEQANSIKQNLQNIKLKNVNPCIRTKIIIKKDRGPSI